MNVLEMSTADPVAISVLITLIGIVGLLGVVTAIQGISHERDLLERGTRLLHDLSSHHDEGFSYQNWLAEQGDLRDSHFADHLTAAAAATRSRRTLQLYELHEISARRESRRLSARFSGGVVGLLLVCGIAGTLWSIKPILGEFAIHSSADGVFDAAASAATATQLVQNLGEAFWPSLIALIFTVILSFARGFYTHNRGVLATQLDRFDIEELFTRFPTPSMGDELSSVRKGLSELVAKIVANQNNFQSTITILKNSAEYYAESNRQLSVTVTKLSETTQRLSDNLDKMLKDLDKSLSGSSPLTQEIATINRSITTLSAHINAVQNGTATLNQNFQGASQTLQQAVDALPKQVQHGCITAGLVVHESSQQAINDAINTVCSETVERYVRQQRITNRRNNRFSWLKNLFRNLRG